MGTYADNLKHGTSFRPQPFFFLFLADYFDALISLTGMLLPTPLHPHPQLTIIYSR